MRSVDYIKFPPGRAAQCRLYYYKFENYVRQIFLNSDTSVALLSGAPFDDPSWWLLPNEQIIEAVGMVNKIAGTRRKPSSPFAWMTSS
jgi:hypothetical protein